ncbi:39S ribosomal protein L30, mitochondrial, partial [Cyphomyrmex costatus]
APTFLNFVRHMTVFMRRRIRYKDAKGNPEGIKYEHVTYFPRTMTTLTISKSHDCYSWFGYPHKNDPVIVKNAPDVCAMLWKIKHLVKIVPIKLPDKLPTPDDLNGTYLHENGTFYVVPKVDPIREEAVEQFINNPKKLNRDIIQEKLRLKWLEGSLM